MQRVIYPLERRNGLLFLRIAVGNRDAPVIARLLVDTGSSYTVISTRILQDAGCDLESALRKISITTAGGLIRAPIVQVSTLNGLGRSVTGYSVVALDLPVSAGADGLLGIDFLMLCGATIVVRSAQITIVPI
jgi:predicted aspartyl protease